MKRSLEIILAAVNLVPDDHPSFHPSINLPTESDSKPRSSDSSHTDHFLFWDDDVRGMGGLEVGRTANLCVSEIICWREGYIKRGVTLVYH
jgi:hypothetical protein